VATASFDRFGTVSNDIILAYFQQMEDSFFFVFVNLVVTTIFSIII
jgi:hypothetical protein